MIPGIMNKKPSAERSKRDSTAPSSATDDDAPTNTSDSVSKGPVVQMSQEVNQLVLPLDRYKAKNENVATSPEICFYVFR
jgi:hypothetical protein